MIQTFCDSALTTLMAINVRQNAAVCDLVRNIFRLCMELRVSQHADFMAYSLGVYSSEFLVAWLSKPWPFFRPKYVILASGTLFLHPGL